MAEPFLGKFCQNDGFRCKGTCTESFITDLGTLLNAFGRGKCDHKRNDCYRSLQAASGEKRENTGLKLPHTSYDCMCMLLKMINCWIQSFGVRLLGEMVRLRKHEKSEP